MGIIDWNLGKSPIQGGANDVASLSSLVNVLYERRVKQAEMEQQRQQEAARLAEIARHNQASEGIDREQLGAQKAHWDASIGAENERARLARQQKASDDVRALRKDYEANLISRQAYEAGMRQIMGEQHGLPVEEPPMPQAAPGASPQVEAATAPPVPAMPSSSSTGYSNDPDALPPEEPPAAPISVQPPPFNPDAPPPAAAAPPSTQPPPFVAGAPGAVADAIQQAPAARPVPTLPAGPQAVLDAFGYDLSAPQTAREQRAMQTAARLEKQAEALIASLPPSQRPHALNAALLALAEARAGIDKPEEAMKTFNTQFRFYLGQAGADRRAALMARTQKEKAQLERPATGSDIENVSRLQADIKNIEAQIADATKSPESFVEFRKNHEEWQRQEAAGKNVAYGTGRALLQGVGVANVAPEQGLRSPAAKRIHGRHQKLKNSIAKGYGGVITDSDREASDSELSLLAASPEEYLQTLMTIRDRLTNNLQNYLENKRINLGAPGGSPARPGAPASPPPSADDDKFLKSGGY